VLTPGEADEMLGMLRRMVSDGDLTVLCQLCTDRIGLVIRYSIHQ
jgi:hypothetical protein